MKQERKLALTALFKAGWLPLCGAVLGLALGILFLIVGFWKTLLLLLLGGFGAVGGFYLRVRMSRIESLRSLFTGEDDPFHDD